MTARLTLLFISLLFLIFTACTPIASRRGTMPDDGRSEESKIIHPEEITPGGFIVDDPNEIIFLADTVATNAEIFALEGEFDRAHKLFLISLDLITSIAQEDVLDTLVDDDRVFNRIAEFYVDLLPPSYLDSVPATISSFVTRYQLYDMLNNMDSAEFDTTLIPYNCDQSTSYNIPITYNLRVQKALTALLSSRRTKWIEKLLNRAQHYRPFMNEMFIEAGLPTDLTFLPLLESAFNPKAYSPAHASGLWQFIPSTGRIFKLRENYWVDERRDPVKSTKAAIGYFTRLHGMFDDWYLSLASYNCGEGRVRRTMRKSGHETYWDLKLPSETMKYVPLFIAYQIISKNPHCFGLNVDTTTAPYDYDAVTVSDCIDLHKIAKGLSVPFDTLKLINPHIKQWCTPPNMKDVTLYIPKGKAEQYAAFYAGLSNKDKVNWYRYKIRSGDVLGSIADRFNVSLSALKSINKMKSSRIIAGRHIFVPISANSTTAVIAEKVSRTAPDKKSFKGKRTTHTIKKGESLYLISLKYNVSVKEICTWNKISSPSKITVGQKIHIYTPTDEISTKKIRPKGDKQYYTVTSGESLFSISLKLGVTVSELAEWNGKNKKKPTIHPGEKLLFYGSPSANSKAKATASDKSLKEASGKQWFYTVQKGESLYSISQKLNLSVAQLVKWNKKDPDRPVIHPGEKIKYFSGKQFSSTQAPKKSNTDTVKGGKKYYTVQKGESLYSISKKLKISVNQLSKWNKKDPNQPTIHPGEKLTYYNNTTTASSKKTGTMKYRIKKGDSIYGIAETMGISAKEIIKLNNLSTSGSIHPGEIIYIPVSGSKSVKKAKSKIVKYRIKKGDNLWSIATTFNVPIREICEASDITRTTALHPGKTLNIPVKE